MPRSCMLATRHAPSICLPRRPHISRLQWPNKACSTQAVVHCHDPRGQATTSGLQDKSVQADSGSSSDSSSNNNGSPNGKLQNCVVHVNSDNLEDLASQLQNVDCPTVFDLGGRTLRSTGSSSSSASSSTTSSSTPIKTAATKQGNSSSSSATSNTNSGANNSGSGVSSSSSRSDEPPGWDVVLSSNDVTIRGGVLELPRGTHLVVRGRNAHLEDLTIRGSHSSSPFIRPLTGLLWIDKGAQDCVLKRVSVTGDPGSNNVLGSPAAAECCAVLVSPGASATLSDCNLSGCKVGLSLAQGAAWKEDDEIVSAVLSADSEQAIREAVESAFLAASVSGHDQEEAEDMDVSGRLIIEGMKMKEEAQILEGKNLYEENGQETGVTADIMVSVESCKIHDNSWHGVLVHGTAESDECVWTHLEMRSSEVLRNGGIGVYVMQHGSRLTAHHSMICDNGRGALHAEMYAQAELVSCTLIGGNRSADEDGKLPTSTPSTPPSSPTGSITGPGSPAGAMPGGIFTSDISALRPMPPLGPGGFGGPANPIDLGAGKDGPSAPRPLSLNFSGGPACFAESFAFVDMHGCMLDEKATVACSGEVISNHCVLSQFKEFSSQGRGPWGAWTWTWIQTLTDGNESEYEEGETESE